MMKITEKCRKKRRAALLAGTVLLLAALAGCVDQSQGKTAENTKDIQTVSGQSKSAETLLEISDPQEKAAVEAAKQKVSAMKTEPRIIATSPAVAEVCSRLGLDLVGICETSVTTLPEEYQDKEQIEQTAGALSKELLYMKFLQGIPVVGAVGGAYDAVYMKRITEYAELKYRHRYLAGRKNLFTCR